MRMPRNSLVASLLLLGAVSAHSMDLMQAWQATQQHDPQAAVAQAARQAGASNRSQAASLWRPGVMLSASAGRMNG